MFENAHTFGNAQQMHSSQRIRHTFFYSHGCSYRCRCQNLPSLPSVPSLPSLPSTNSTNLATATSRRSISHKPRCLPHLATATCHFHNGDNSTNLEPHLPIFLLLNVWAQLVTNSVVNFFQDPLLLHILRLCTDLSLLHSLLIVRTRWKVAWS